MFFKNFKNAIIIGLFAILFSSSTALVYILTKKIIFQHDQIHSIYLLHELIHLEEYELSSINNCYLIKNDKLGDDQYHRFWLLKKKGLYCAFIIETTAPDGYAGLINILVAADLHGNIIGARVINHHETPGLGDKIDIQQSDWIKHFCGICILSLSQKPFLIKKDGGFIDQFTGASITPRSVVNSIKNSVFFILQSLSEYQLIDIKGLKINVYKK
ncbi:Ion-translocating oxidoreductase complex subunit G [Buchnera aphidicola (Eriosoma grossulariae)]|uniref:electron transport complex subunit RsxG n=1 Tax=Buchnera aphidicola TaxID=9 RepID=UPI003464E077